MGLFLFILSGALNITIRYTKKRHAKMRDVYAFLSTQKEMRQHDF